MNVESRFLGYAAAVIVSMTPLSITAQAKYSGGTGEPNDPYQIATAADLSTLGETPGDYDKHFILTADIARLTGVFDGDGRTISYLRIATNGRVVGLFGHFGILCRREGPSGRGSGRHWSRRPYRLAGGIAPAAYLGHHKANQPSM